MQVRQVRDSERGWKWTPARVAFVAGILVLAFVGMPITSSVLTLLIGVLVARDIWRRRVRRQKMQ